MAPISDEQLARNIGARRATREQASAVGLSSGWIVPGGEIISTTRMQQRALSKMAQGGILIPYSEYLEFWAAMHDMSKSEARSDPEFQRLWKEKESNRRKLRGSRGKVTPEREKHIAALVALGVLEKQNGSYGYTNAWIEFTLRSAA